MAKKKSENSITNNRKAFHEYHIIEKYEAGIVLEGWEVKSIREARVHLKESYVLLKEGEAWLFGAHITPLASASSHIHPVPTRTRKLLLHEKEIQTLFVGVQRKGYTAIPLSLYWKDHLIKVSIALASGKKSHDKRAADKDSTWKRDKARLLKGKLSDK
jgi:SsrA-binding protein